MKRMSMIVMSLLLAALLLGSAAWAETESADVENPYFVGIWTYTDEENGIGAVYDLKEDGTGTYTMIVGEEEVTYELKYEVQDNLLLVTYVNNETFTEDDVFENEFRFEDEQTLVIKDSFDEEMTFVKKCVGSVVMAEEAATVTAHDYLGEWVDQDGMTNIDITTREEGDGYIVNVQMNVEGEDGTYTYVVWAYGCVYDEETHAMKSISRVTGTGDYEPDSEEQIDDTDFEYADAEFCFDDAGKLVWNDANLSEDEGKLFEHTYGWKDPDYVGPGHHFAGEWNDERVTVYIEETMEDYQVAVVGSGSATDGAIWTYTCDYDAGTDSLVSNGEVATKVNYTYVDAENSTEELVYKDGEAVFSLNGEGLLVWDDKKEQAGEGRAFALVTAEATEEESSEEELQVTGRTVEPMVPEYDLDALADGVYPVYFDPANLADGTLSLTVYSQDVFDIVDISTLEVGDSLVVNDIPFVVETLERDDGDLLINGGLDNDGLTLCAFDEDNCWKVVMEDDHNTYTERGDATLPLADDVTFTDGWDIEKDPVTVSGAEAVADAITGTDMNYFSSLNTTVRVEGGKIVEIVRAYMP